MLALAGVIMNKVLELKLDIVCRCNLELTVQESYWLYSSTDQEERTNVTHKINGLSWEFGLTSNYNSAMGCRALIWFCHMAGTGSKKEALSGVQDYYENIGEMEYYLRVLNS